MTFGGRKVLKVLTFSNFYYPYKFLIMKKYILLLALLFTIQISFSQNKAAEILKNKEKSDYVSVAIHRGVWVYVPENSIPALEYAIQFGADIMETDVRLTKDNQLIIMHDYTVDRTTNGTGKVSDLMLSEIKKLRLRNNYGGMTDLQVPTLEEFIQVAKGKIVLYYDKAGYDLPEKSKGDLVKRIIETAAKYDYLEESMFVLDWTYNEAFDIFGENLTKVIYCPVIEDNISDLDTYVNQFLSKLQPIAFQFRFDSLDSNSYKQLQKIHQSSSKAFVAATWKKHTANHDDLISILERPSKGWGWLIEQGFSIIETNYLNEILEYLKMENRR